MAPFQSWRGIFGLLSAAGGRRGAHQARHAHRRASDLVAPRGRAAAGLALEADGAPGLGRAVERADAADVGEALAALGLGAAVLQDAVAEVQQLGGELVAL